MSTEEKILYPLRQIYFYLTGDCNLKCRHCWLAPTYHSPDTSSAALDVERFRQIIKEAKPLGLSGVKLTGGEPLFHPHIHEIVDMVHSEGLRLVMETNGVLCNREIAEKIAACKDSFVSVSLDGADAKTHEWIRGVPGCFDASVEGVRHLVKAGISPQVIMALMKHNKSQMASVVRLAESMGAGSVKFNIVQPTARGKNMHQSEQTLSIEELVEIGKWVENTLSTETDLPLHYSHPIAFRPLGKMFGHNGDGCGVCGIFSILGVLSDGTYALCGIGENVPELVFGQAGKDNLEAVWNNNAVLNELREGLPGRLSGICGDCLMKGVCLGSCIAQNYYESKNLWSPFWYCKKAREAGLFPASRIKN